MAIPFNLKVHWLSTLGLVQEAPRVRTVLTYPQNTMQVVFPWISFGYNEQSDPPETWIGTNKFINVFFHNRPWKNLSDAVEVLRVPQRDGLMAFNTYSNATCCVGRNMVFAIQEKRLTPSDTFWQTTNIRLVGARNNHQLPPQMFDVKHPDRVLKVQWPHIYHTSDFRFNQHIDIAPIKRRYSYANDLDIV